MNSSELYNWQKAESPTHNAAKCKVGNCQWIAKKRAAQGGWGRAVRLSQKSRQNFDGSDILSARFFAFTLQKIIDVHSIFEYDDCLYNLAFVELRTVCYYSNPFNL